MQELPYHSEKGRNVIGNCRAMLTKDKVDKWYSHYRDLVANLGVLEKPKRIFNSEETGFSLESKTGNVIGPLKKDSVQLPHVSGGHSKQRLTDMFCGSANGNMIPPFFICPAPRTRGFNP